MTEAELDQIKQHYFDLGITEGKRKFRVWDFINGLYIGCCVAVILIKIFRL